MNKKFKQTEIGEIPEDWKLEKIGDLCKVGRGASPRPVGDPRYFAKDGYPWIKIADANRTGTRFVEDTREHVNEEGKKRSVFLKKGQLIVSNSGSAGIPKFLSIDGCIHDGWLYFQEYKELDVNFFYYFWLCNGLQISETFANGAVLQNLNTNVVRNINIALPSIIEQQQIASILSSIDDKIELNRKLNKTLEDVAKALFKHWFVDFEFPNNEGKPYKSSGGEMVESEYGAIPKGWNIESIGKRLKTYLGGTPSRDRNDYWENGTVPWINSGKVNDFRIIEPSEYITELGLHKSATKLLPKRTVVIAITGATLGQYSMLEFDSCFNQSVVGIKESANLRAEYVYFWIGHTIKELINSQTGGAQQHINKQVVDNHKILIPTDVLLADYYAIATPIFNQVTECCFQTKTLINIRESLLPKLMSGKIRAI